MGQVLIRDLDDALIADFRRVAEVNGRSLEDELRVALAQVRPKARLNGNELTALVHRLWAMTPSEAARIDSTPLIRAARDAT